jgi:hypothetical protein
MERVGFGGGSRAIHPASRQDKRLKRRVNRIEASHMIRTASIVAANEPIEQDRARSLDERCIKEKAG